MAWSGFYWLRIVAGEGSCGRGTVFRVNADIFLSTPKKMFSF